jgi:hypothetical protein
MKAVGGEATALVRTPFQVHSSTHIRLRAQLRCEAASALLSCWLALALVSLTALKRAGSKPQVTIDKVNTATKYTSSIGQKKTNPSYPVFAQGGRAWG